MFAKVLVLVVSVVAASCHDHPHAYHLRNVVHHQQQKEYKPYEHHIRVQPEPSSSEEYKLPESHGQAYSSQSIHHGLAAYQESHESNEHVAPVYQYVEEHEQAHHEAPVKPKYHTAQYALPGHQEIKSVRVPVHHKPHVHFQPESHEVRYHHPIIEHAAPVHHAVPVHHSAPVHHASAHHEESHESHDEPIDYYAYPKYQYEYKVEDPHTGDNKFQHETRDGDVVKGVYGLHEADGSIRTVEYSSDKHNGFTAVVKHTAPGQHVQIETHHQN